MGETAIQWTATVLDGGLSFPGYTFNGWIGCEKVSEGCRNCYAEVDTYSRVSKSRGLPLWGGGAARHITSDANWRKPLGWNREARRSGIRRKVFCSSLSDVFECRQDLLVPRARLFALVADTPWLDWLLLTKRPENADPLWRTAQICSRPGLTLANESPWLRNVWLGTTCENQERADERIPHLLTVPARVRFVSYEPALGPVDFAPALGAHGYAGVSTNRVDWIICGGESGPKARPYNIAWPRSVIAQCKAARVAVFHKQLGRRPFERRRHDPLTYLDGAYDAPIVLNDSHGGDIDEWPHHLADLRVREFPTVRP